MCSCACLEILLFFGKKLIIYIYYNSKLLYFSITNILRSVMNYYTKNLFHPQIHNTCGAKGIGDPGPFHIKPMAHAEEEEMSENEQRKSRLPGYIAEDNLILGEPRSQKGKMPRHQGESPRASQRKAQVQWAGHRGMVEKQSQKRLSHLH